MTVKELISILKTADPDKEVFLDTSDNRYSPKPLYKVEEDAIVLLIPD